MINLDRHILPGLLLLFLLRPACAAELQGTLHWSGKSQLGFVVPGKVALVKAQPGVRVKKGQLLVQLEQRPFKLEVKKFKAGTETIEPLLFDAKVELDQARELYDRTVLSQIELQKVEARYRGLQAQSRVAQMDYELAKWRQDESSLMAPFDAVVIENHFSPGQVVAEENKGNLAVSLAPAEVMAVSVQAAAGDLQALQPGQAVKVVIDSEQLPGVVQQLDLRGNDKGLYPCVIEFTYTTGKIYYAGQTVKVVF